MNRHWRVVDPCSRHTIREMGVSLLMLNVVRCGLFGIAACALAGVASGQTTLSQWQFNPPTTLGTLSVPTVGSGSFGAVNLSGTTPNTTITLLTSTSGPTGSLTDPLGSGTSNWGVAVGNYEALGGQNAVRGFQVSGISTSGAPQVQIGASLKVGRNASQFWQLYTTIDGTSFSAVSGGLATITAIGTGSQAPSSVSMSNAGLLTFVSATGAYTNADPSGYASFTYTLPSGQGFENNSSFGFRVLSVWDPAGSNYVAASPTGIYAGSGVGASILVDMVTVAAVPEPSTFVMAMGAAVAGMLLSRRRPKITAGRNV